MPYGVLTMKVDLAVVDQLDDGPLAVRSCALGLLCGRPVALMPLRLSTSAVPEVASSSKPCATSSRAGKIIERLSRLATEDEGAALGQWTVGARLGLAYAVPKMESMPMTSPVEAHLRAEDGVDAASVDVAEARPRHDGLLDGDRRVERQLATVTVRGEQPLRPQLGDGRAQRDPGGGLRQRHRGRLRG